MKRIVINILNNVISALASLSIQRSTVIKAFSLKRKRPLNLQNGEETYFVQEFNKDFNPVTKAVVKNARLLVNEGLAIKHYHIIGESLMHESVRNWYGPGFLVKAYANSQILKKEKYLCLYNHYGVGYGHWLADVIPRLFVIKEELKNYKILLPENYNTFHYISLEPFGISPDQIVFLKLDSVYKIPDLTIVSHVGSSCNTKDEVLQEIRDFYLDYYIGKNRIKPFRKIYISRSGVNNRKVVNNDEVEALMIDNGYEIIHPQNYNFEEQVKLFSECKTMVGLTGSGLTNMLFMPKGGSVVEFKMQNDFTNLHYFSMASGMQLDYYYLLCEVKGEDRFTADFIVNITELEKTLQTVN